MGDEIEIIESDKFVHINKFIDDNNFLHDNFYKIMITKKYFNDA